jgi:hypothetical protein
MRLACIVKAGLLDWLARVIVSRNATLVCWLIGVIIALEGWLIGGVIVSLEGWLIGVIIALEGWLIGIIIEVTLTIVIVCIRRPLVISAIHISVSFFCKIVLLVFTHLQLSLLL